MLKAILEKHLEISLKQVVYLLLLLFLSLGDSLYFPLYGLPYLYLDLIVMILSVLIVAHPGQEF